MPLFEISLGHQGTIPFDEAECRGIWYAALALRIADWRVENARQLKASPILKRLRSSRSDASRTFGFWLNDLLGSVIEHAEAQAVIARETSEVRDGVFANNIAALVAAENDVSGETSSTLAAEAIV